jgi:hypothetical protein
MNVLPVHERLIAAAKTEEEFVFYSEVIELGGLKHLGGDALSGALGRLLYEVDQHDWTQDPERPMLSAIAVSSQTMTPSGGFYTFARDLGKLQSKEERAELAFWLRELKALRDYWCVSR